MGFLGQWLSASLLVAGMFCVPAMAEPASTDQSASEDAVVEDAWTALESRQLNMAMGEILDDSKQKPLSLAAQKRYGLEGDGGERFIVCMMGLGGHPDFSTAKVEEAMDVCSRNLAPGRRN